MSDALGMFLNNLFACSGKPGRQISIISDNARRIQDADFDGRASRRRGIRRSSSTPLDHMASRWESASSFDSVINAGASPTRTHPTLVRERSSRWESESSSGRAPKLPQPKRESGMDQLFLSPVHDTGKLRSKNSASTFKSLQDISTSNLPKSLRSLPY